ncbi:MAG: hemolysin family protein [Brevinema sp.]
MNFILILLFLALLILLMMSALLSASETAFFSIDELKLRHYKPNDVRSIRLLFTNATLVLSSILIVNTTTNITLTTLFELWFKEMGIELNLIMSTIIVSGILIIFGEILPKSFAASQGQIMIPFILKPLTSISKSLSKVAAPINRFAIWFTEKFTHIIPDSENKDDRRLALYNIVAHGNFLNSDEKMLIGRVLSLSERKVGAVMTPRPRMYSIADDTTLQELKDELIAEQHSKVPIYKEQDNNVVGLLHYEDVALQLVENKNLTQTVSDFMRPIYFVPESKTLGSLLEDFRAKSIKLAGVVDEYGDFLGIVTLSDIMVELVGEVIDEDFEKDQEVIPQLLNRYVVKGEMSLIDFNESFNTDLYSKEYETVAGFLIEQAGGIPPLYYTFETDTIIITVREKSATRIKTLSVRVKS